MNRISIIAPVALGEELLDLASWRSNANSNAKLRLEFMLKSFFAKFDVSMVAEFLLVAPSRDAAAIKSMLEALGLVDKVRLATDESFFQRIGFPMPPMARQPGWYVQQLIKLGYSKICETGYYLTMDSDVITASRVSHHALFPDGKRSLVGIETLSDYVELYTDRFAARERKIKERYYASSHKILKSLRLTGQRYRNRDYYFSESPVVLNADVGKNLLAEIARASGCDADKILLSQRGWTEYGLYFSWLELTNALQDHHILGNRNSVLSLDNSVWQQSDYYRHSRNYPGCFVAAHPENKFVALQSWVPAEKWLPSKYADVSALYDDIGALLKL